VVDTGRRLTVDSESDSNSMDDVEPDSDVDKDYDSDKDPAWKPHAASHTSATAAASVCILSCEVTVYGLGLMYELNSLPVGCFSNVELLRMTQQLQMLLNPLMPTVAI